MSDDIDEVLVLARLVNDMKKAGVHSAEYMLTGSGDSTDGHDTTLFANDNREDPNYVMSVNNAPTVFTDIHAKVDAYCEDISDKHFSTGWWNNGGGYVKIEITTDPPSCKAELWEYPEPEAELSDHRTVEVPPNFEVVPLYDEPEHK